GQGLAVRLAAGTGTPAAAPAGPRTVLRATRSRRAAWRWPRRRPARHRAACGPRSWARRGSPGTASAGTGSSDRAPRGGGPAEGGGVRGGDRGIEPFVVAEVESLLLKFPFQVPVGFGEKHGLRVLGAQLGYDGRPELLGWRRSGVAAPGLGEDLVGQQHGHVA